MQLVLATRKPVTRPVVVRADPVLDRASPECHRSIFLALAIRKPVTRPLVVRVEPDLARASPE